MRRKERAEEKAELDAAMLTASAPAVEETQPDTKPQQTVVREKTVEPRKRAEKNEKAEKKETPDKTEKTEKDRVTENTALPIGTKLDILDQQLTFDQQISRLDQGIGSTANRLTMDETPSEEEEPEIEAPNPEKAKTECQAPSLSPRALPGLSPCIMWWNSSFSRITREKTAAFTAWWKTPSTV